MRKVVLALLVVLFTAAPALAGSAYDWQSGNQYYWNQDASGNTNLQGHNFRTGSQWRTNIRPNGDMSGWDSRGNYWNYDSNTGNYWNSNGRTCFGRGYSRTCF